jgi:hypothetical protein
MTGSEVAAAHGLNSLRRLCAPVVARVRLVLSCGLTPQKLALTLCLGIAIGIIPLVWGTSLICFILAGTFRLNHIALQSVNCLLWPVNLALMVPFFKLGAWLFPGGPPLPQHIFSTPAPGAGFPALSLFGWLTLKAVAAWAVTALPAALLAYGIVRLAQLRSAARPRQPAVITNSNQTY